MKFKCRHCGQVFTRNKKEVKGRITKRGYLSLYCVGKKTYATELKTEGKGEK